jgi:hypothetical protein
MGFELNAFLGKTSDLRGWKDRLPSAVVCHLGGDFAMVPVTGHLAEQLRVRLGDEPSHEEAVRRWGVEASGQTIVAYLSVGEFGNQSHERATLWSGGRELLSRVTASVVLDFFRETAGLDLGGTTPVTFEQHRGELAAEKWASG